MFDPTLRRFIWLYARSRNLLPIIIGSLLLLALATWWANELAAGIEARDDRLRLRLQLAAVVPLIAGTLMGLGTASPSGELDDAAPELPRRMRMILTLGGVLLLGAVYLAAGRTWTIDRAGLLLARNFAGWTGSTLAGLPLLGTSRAWMPAIAWAGVSLFSNNPNTVNYPAWAWTMRPGDDWLALLLAASLLAAGLAVLAWTPFRTMSE